MRVRVLFFGILRDLAGKAGDFVELPEGASVRDLLQHCERQAPQLKESLLRSAVAVNQVYAGVESLLRADDEVAILPPVSGGTAEAASEAPADSAQGKCQPCARAAIVRQPIDTVAVLDCIKRGDDGAAVVFEGVVRNQTRGRQTLYLHYEAYEEMALKQMEALAEQALRQFPIRDVSLVHRLGRLEIGETSVLIVVASPHRPAAFDACRWLIDTLKRTVPIWKKEFFEDGAVWADGEPFPPEISAASSQASGSPTADDASK